MDITEKEKTRNLSSFFAQALIQANDISPEVRFLLMYFKFNEMFGNVTTAQALEDLKPFWGQTKVRNVMNQALEAGYMKREYIRGNKGGRWIKYHVACNPVWNPNIEIIDIYEQLEELNKHKPPTPF